MGKRVSAIKPRIICVDLDGTILSYEKGWLGVSRFGNLLPGAREGLRKLMLDGWWVIIYTCRGHRHLVKDELIGRGILKGIHYSAINKRKNVLAGTYRGKIGADVYLDDRAVTFTGNWKDAYKKITGFKSWQGIEKVW